MNLKVTVIIPVYNADKYLNKCLDSIINQTLKDIEIIAVNDGSTDDSQIILDTYKEKYPQLFTIINKPNEGQAIARNMALKKASGKYVTFVDSDDWINETMLEKLYNAAEKEQADIVYTKCILSSSNKETIEKYMFSEADSLKNYLINQSGPANKLVKTDIITKNNLYFPNLRSYEDISVVPLWGIHSKKVIYYDEPLYYYFLHEGSVMRQTVYNDKLDNIFISLDNLYDGIKKSNMLDKYHQELEWIFIEHLLHASSLRFFTFDNYQEKISKVIDAMSKRFPNWKNNNYLKKQNIKYKIVCNLFYEKKYKILKLILK